ADDVHLINGRVFEDVIAEVTESTVRIKMAEGSLSLPREQVARVVESDSSLEEYLRRKEALRRVAEVRASDWLDLALWARTQGLEHGVREATMTAAQIDPRLAGLEPLMRGYGYVYEAELNSWIPFSDSMRRRGLVYSRGEWIPREEYQRAQEAERARIEARLESSRRANAEARAAYERRERLEREREEEKEARHRRRHEQDVFDGPLLLFPGGFYLPVYPGRPGGGTPETPRPGTGGGFTRVPGSLIPGNLGGPGK
ncbi:MAG TPA: hypothetical protein VHN15_10125, partial [Thermoanaerobaculia bacterium]|nr:hypothetical protein [Thermoanaerobaculia bacterium]